MSSGRPSAADEYVFDDDDAAVEPPDAVVDAPADDDVDDTADDTAADDAPASRAERPAGRRPVLVLALVSVLVASMVALGVVFLVAAANSGDDAGDNRAVVDQAATTQVIGEVSQALNQILTYDAKNPDPTRQAAAAVLTGDAAGQYQTLFTALQQKAPGQELTLTTKTVQAAVSSLTGNTAQLLVFLDQSSTRASDGTTSSSAAQVQITAVLQGGSWKISELQPI